MTLLAVAVVLILAAGAATACLPRGRVADGAYGLLFTVGGLVGAVPALCALRGAELPNVQVVAGVPGGPWVFGVDALSAVFLLAIFGVGATSALYGIAYFRHEQRNGAVRVGQLFTAVLVAALALVVTARAAVPFLVAWEVMAVAGYVLIVFDHASSDVRRAGLLYLVATHTGTLVLFGMFAAWGHGGADLTFASLAERASLLPSGGAWILVLALAGFGFKAGIVPFHFWLPEAHAAAPSHISALLSGVVIKMGVYGLFRVVSLLGPPPAWWAWLLLGLGVASGVLGVVWALAQHDLKRLLAFHSVENIGIILIGMGAGALGLAYGNATVGVLGFGGAALHTLNHALFKSLLFLGAGSVVHGAGTREIDRLGGLARRMPSTATTFLIGSAAIVGLPPLNGFISEWLVLRSLLDAGLSDDALRLAVLAAAALGLIGALALACFAKVVGVLFLGTPRDPAAAAVVHESTGGMLRPIATLAAACVAIGLLPIVVVPAALRVGALAAGQPADLGTPGFDPAASTLTVFSVGLAAGLLILWILRRRVSRGSRALTGSAETWACGYSAPTARMQYTASSFAAPILAAYGSIAGVREHRTPVILVTHAVDPVLDAIVRPAWRGVRTVANRFRPLQRGRLGHYLLYLGVAVVVLLLYLLLAGRTP